MMVIHAGRATIGNEGLLAPSYGDDDNVMTKITEFINNLFGKK